MTFIQVASDTLTQVPINVTIPAGGSSAATTLTIPKDGHYAIGVVVDGAMSQNSFGSTVTVTVSGAISSSQTSDGFTNTGTNHFHGGAFGHGFFTAGTTVTVVISNTFTLGGSATGVIYAHFVPIPGTTR